MACFCFLPDCDECMVLLQTAKAQRQEAKRARPKVSDVPQLVVADNPQCTCYLPDCGDCNKPRSSYVTKSKSMSTARPATATRAAVGSKSKAKKVKPGHKRSVKEDLDLDKQRPIMDVKARRKSCIE